MSAPILIAEGYGSRVTTGGTTDGFRPTGIIGIGFRVTATVMANGFPGTVADFGLTLSVVVAKLFPSTSVCLQRAVNRAVVVPAFPALCVGERTLI